MVKVELWLKHVMILQSLIWLTLKSTQTSLLSNTV